MHHIYCDTMQRLTTGQTNTLTIELMSGGTIEIYAEDEKEWRRWTKHIALLLSIPHYPIPEEPREVALPNELLNNVDPRFYDSKGVMAWGLCVLQDGIGARASLKHALCVAVVTEDDQVKIFPWKVTAPQITWDRNKLRRSGSIGDLVFLEAGRRCRFGPGLLWMYTKSEVALSLREGLHTFLFKGNKEVAMTARRGSQVSICSQRSSGVDVSFDSGGMSQTPEGSGSGVFCRQTSFLSTDSVASDSGIGKSRSPEYKPPVPLHSHPSLRRKHCSPSRGSVQSFNDSDSPEPEDITPARSQTMPIGMMRQVSEDLFDLDGVSEDRRSPPQQAKADDQYVKMNRSSQSPPDTTKDYIPMAPKWSSPQSGPSHLNVSEPGGLHYPQNQEKLMNGMNGLNGMSPYDNCKLKSLPRKPMAPNSYDNVHIKPHWENYENTAITKNRTVK